MSDQEIIAFTQVLTIFHQVTTCEKIELKYWNQAMCYVKKLAGFKQGWARKKTFPQERKITFSFRKRKERKIFSNRQKESKERKDFLSFRRERKISFLSQKEERKK